MKTHELAKGLEQLAEFLRSQRNIELRQLSAAANRQKELGTSDIAVNLSTLAALSRIDKQQWLKFIYEYGLPIDVRPRDASRDLIGKVLRYLDENKSAQKKLLSKSRRGEQQVSPELMKALDVLLSR